MKNIRLYIILVLAAAALSVGAAGTVNPILRGFNPDPSICRVGSDYYICCSSFTWFPGLPIYHSRDLVHWELIGHAIDREGMVDLDGVKDKDGLWAPTIRHHDGVWYIFCNVSNRGNFYVTAKDVGGPWSQPVFIKDAPGIDPSVFWDDDGKAYFMANTGKFPGRKYASSTAIWMQEIDLTTGTLVGKREYLTSGHALNAKYAEGAHLFKVGGRYVMTLSEGGTHEYHAATVLTSRSLWGPYLPQTVNPVLSQRQFGFDFPIQCVGHVDMVQTPGGRWYAVALGKRMVDGRNAFTRETFLCPVDLQQGELIFNPGKGGMTLDVEKPGLEEWHGVELPDSDTFEAPLSKAWYCNRVPHRQFHKVDGGRLCLDLMPETIDSLVCPAMLLRRVREHDYEAATKLEFAAKGANEVAGMVLHRNNTAYVALLKTKGAVVAVVNGKEQARMAYSRREVCMRIRVRGLEALLECGETAASMTPVATVSLLPLADDKALNRFNGPGIGVYASGGGRECRRQAFFDYFYYKDN